MAARVVNSASDRQVRKSAFEIEAVGQIMSNTQQLAKQLTEIQRQLKGSNSQYYQKPADSDCTTCGSPYCGEICLETAVYQGMIHTQTTTIRDGETTQIFLGEIGIKAIMQTVVKEEIITKRTIRIKDLKAKVSDNNRTKSKVVEVVWKVILPMDRKDKALGKWSPNWEGPFRILRVFSNNAYEIEELDFESRIFRINGKYLKRYKRFLQIARA